MSRQDGTGPDGRGPRTGRGLGYCPPNDDGDRFTRVGFFSRCRPLRLFRRRHAG